MAVAPPVGRGCLDPPPAAPRPSSMRHDRQIDEHSNASMCFNCCGCAAVTSPLIAPTFVTRFDRFQVNSGGIWQLE